jgi:hypothetical protein
MSAEFPAAAPRMTLRYGSIPDGHDAPLICGMFTPSYALLAERLVGSLLPLGLPHAIFEVPTVHRSISPRGSDDPSYTKANFLWHVLGLANRAVLYLDVDCVVRRRPELVARLVAGGHDLATVNWLGPDRNDAYVPALLADNLRAPAALPRYYQHSYHVDFVTDEQLLCSGAVQLWGNTAAARGLLAAWFATIVVHPGVPDDECMNFTFNNPVGSWRAALRPSWLPKSYARYPWWIFDEPIIDHPDIPYQGAWNDVADPAARRSFYPERAAVRTTVPFIPRDCVIDVRTGEIFQLKHQQLAPAGRRWQQGIWPLAQPLELPHRAAGQSA